MNHVLPLRTALPGSSRELIDRFGRRVEYVRISVTDRCDLRCVYCMAESMQFLPRSAVLSFEEIETIAAAFIARGVTKLRLTGGEPLVRRDILDLVTALGRRIGVGRLEELTLTTNGTQLSRFAEGLAGAGVRRINVSLDTRDPERFAAIARRDRLGDVLEGIAVARAAGLAVKINMVPMRGVNEDEIVPMMEWAHEQGMALTLIEAMPLGEVGIDRAAAHLSLRAVCDRLAERFTLEKLDHRTGGPARYARVAETGGLVGFITPLSHNFCESCNRVRLTARGVLYMCLGQEAQVNLREALRDGGLEALDAAMDAAMALKPEGHDFVVERGAAPALARHMSVTGG